MRWLTDLAGYGREGRRQPDERRHDGELHRAEAGAGLGIGDRAQHEGVRERWAVYVSDQRHVSVDKAVDAIGLGREALRALPTDAEFRVRIDALEEAIEKDKRDGVRPMCVVGMFRNDEHGGGG